MLIPGFHVLAALRPRVCLPPIWQEAVGLVALAGSGVDHATSLPRRGPRGPVVLVPGLLAGDALFSRLHAYLQNAGHDVHGAAIACNVDCSEVAARRLLERVAEVSERYGEPVTLVGHSRGGLLARVVSQRRPDLVAGVVTLGSPYRDQLAVHPLLWAQIMAVAALGSIGVPGLLNVGCAIGPCCEAFRRDLAAPLPAGVATVSVFSRRDGVVDWRACIDEHADNVEVRATHCGMLFDPGTCAEVADAAARFAQAASVEQSQLGAGEDLAPGTDATHALAQSDGCRVAGRPPCARRSSPPWGAPGRRRRALRAPDHPGMRGSRRDRCRSGAASCT
ncbi:MAG TPA: alpha/beta fold hydrolase [Solirubrobacteraceae bacterium]